MTIGLLSDTHGYLDDKLLSFFENCDEIWHAGDIGTLDVMKVLESEKPTRAVFGNIDGPEIRAIYPEHHRFEVEGKNVWMTHIGGAPPRYDRGIRRELKSNPPDIFICGHSHMLKVVTDEQLNNMLYLNPGAAGRQGFHRIRTAMRFEIIAADIKNLQVIELGMRAR